MRPDIKLENLDYDFYDQPIICSRTYGWQNFLVEKFSVQTPTVTDWFRLDQNMFAVSVSGKVRLEYEDINNSFLEMESGKALIYTTPADLPMRFVVQETPRDVIFVRFEPRFIANVIQQSSDCNLKFSLTPTALDEVSSNLALLLIAELNHNGSHGRLYADSIGTALASYLLTDPHKPRQILRDSGLSPRRTKHLLDYIEIHLDQDLSLPTLAQQAQVSLFHFCHLFKRTVGLSPHQYVLERRISKAKDLLKHTDRAIMEIGFAVGYQNQSHFSQAFRKVVGVSPKEYRDT